MQEVDPVIIEACKKRDTKAEYALYRHCFAILMPVCFRYVNNEDDAADLLNKGFLKILNNLEKYDVSKSFTAWIKSIMVNTIIDEFRATKMYRNTIQQTELGEFSPHIHPVDYNEAEARITAKELQGYIAKLPEASKVVLNLYVFDGLSHKEIAEKMSISEGTSKWHLSNARSMLKKMIGNVFSTLKTYVL